MEGGGARRRAARRRSRGGRIRAPNGRIRRLRRRIYRRGGAGARGCADAEKTDAGGARRRHARESPQRRSGRGNARGGGRCPRPRERLCGRCGVRRRCSAEHGGGRGGCGRHETEPAARAGRAARGQGAPVWAVRHPLGAEDGGMETKLGGGLVWCCDSCVPRLGRPWQWCRLAAANVCSGVSELRAKALTRSFLVEWRRRLRASLSLLRVSFWSKNPVAQVSG